MKEDILAPKRSSSLANAKPVTCFTPNCGHQHWTVDISVSTHEGHKGDSLLKGGKDKCQSQLLIIP